MRGQTKNDAQQATVVRLLGRGWREGDMFDRQVPMYRDRPYRFGRWSNAPDPCVVRIDRAGKIHRGYPGCNKGRKW